MRNPPPPRPNARDHTPTGARLASGLLAGALLTGILPIPGCASRGEDRAARPQTVEPGAFRAEAGEAGAVTPPPVTPPGTNLSAPPAGNGGDLAVGGNTPARTPGSFRVRPGEPVMLADAGAAIEPPQLLDAKVGDINGRPVFISEFLRPIEGRLRAEANRLGRDEWMRTAAGIIQQEMRALITDELLKAEALSKLTVDQKAGLRRFLDDVRDNLLSQNRGSQQLAEERLRREQGLSQEEFLRQREDRTLVRYTLQEEIQDRINVSWRDIVQRYARDESKYNPEPTARYYILRVDADNQQAIDTVTQALASGGSFPDLASGELNTWTLDEGGFRDVALEDGPASVSLFPMPELNDPAAALRVGQITEPIPFGSSVMWIHLASIDQESTSLYDAQLAISDQIRNERTAEELERYIDRLLGRASVSDVDRMLVRLLSIAAERYGPPVAARPVQPRP
jgi:hypothetical protein